jgi:hypothetical protein
MERKRKIATFFVFLCLCCFVFCLINHSNKEKNTSCAVPIRNSPAVNLEKLESFCLTFVQSSDKSNIGVVNCDNDTFGYDTAGV